MISRREPRMGINRHLPAQNVRPFVSETILWIVTLRAFRPEDKTAQLVIFVDVPTSE
jgi:hypothetical protein